MAPVYSDAKNVQRTRDELSPEPSTHEVYKVKSEIINVEEGPTQVNLIGGGHAFIIGDTTNGVLGTANGVDGSQITLGTASLGTGTSEYYIFNPSNLFNERFNFTTFVDTTNSTGTQSTSAGTYTVGSGEILYSGNVIYEPNTNIYRVKVYVDADDDTLLTAYVRTLTRAGSAYPWEPVTLSTNYELTTPEEKLQYRVDCSGGTAEITRVRIKYS